MHYKFKPGFPGLVDAAPIPATWSDISSGLSVIWSLLGNFVTINLLYKLINFAKLKWPSRIVQKLPQIEPVVLWWIALHRNINNNITWGFTSNNVIVVQENSNFKKYSWSLKRYLCMVGRCKHCHLVSIDGIVLKEVFHFFADLWRCQFWTPL